MGWSWESRLETGPRAAPHHERTSHRDGSRPLPGRSFPSVGYDRASGIAWAGPYVGDGVATSNLAGRVLRNLITGRDDPLNRLPVVNHASPRWEVEPFRWLGVNTVCGRRQRPTWRSG